MYKLHAECSIEVFPWFDFPFILDCSTEYMTEFLPFCVINEDLFMNDPNLVNDARLKMIQFVSSEVHILGNIPEKAGTSLVS
jgi:hypothetical protein